MGCGGGYRDIFRLLDSYSYSRRSCGDTRQYQQFEKEDELILIKKMYAEDLINEEEYQNYKKRIYEGSLGFDELITIRRNRVNREFTTKTIETKSNILDNSSKYKHKIKKLEESKRKIEQVQEKLINSINELESEKKRIESLKEAMLKTSEESAERYINRKIEIEESIQRLLRSRKELEDQLVEINNSIKRIEAKEIELEALKLQEEISKIKLEE